jgi:hypothetical protein
MHEPTTRACARKLNLQIHSNLVNCVLELTLGVIDVLMIKDFGEKNQGLRKAKVSRGSRSPQPGGDQVQLGSGLV